MIAEHTRKSLFSHIGHHFGTLRTAINQIADKVDLVVGGGCDFVEQVSEADIVAMNVANKNTSSSHEERESPDY